MVLSFLTMIFRRKRTIFHVEESLPDPEEIKLRFRRRIMLLSFLGAIGILSIPVLKDLEDSLRIKQELRKLSDYILESKKLAARTRRPVLLTLSEEGRNWSRFQSLKSDSCEVDKRGNAPESLQTNFSWSLNLKSQAGESVQSTSLCFHPILGALIGNIVLGDSQLLLSARTGDPSAQSESYKAAYLLISRSGDEIQFAGNL